MPFRGKVEAWYSEQFSSVCFVLISLMAWMTDNNMPGGLFRWFTAVGEPRGSKTDFYNIYVASSMAERGQAHDMMIAGGNQALQSAYGDLVTCDDPRVWHAQPVGGKSGS